MGQFSQLGVNHKRVIFSKYYEFSKQVKVLHVNNCWTHHHIIMNWITMLSHKSPLPAYPTKHAVSKRSISLLHTFYLVNLSIWMWEHLHLMCQIILHSYILIQEIRSQYFCNSNFTGGKHNNSPFKDFLAESQSYFSYLTWFYKKSAKKG